MARSAAPEAAQRWMNSPVTLLVSSLGFFGRVSVSVKLGVPFFDGFQQRLRGETLSVSLLQALRQPQRGDIIQPKVEALGSRRKFLASPERAKYSRGYVALSGLANDDDLFPGLHPGLFYAAPLGQRVGTTVHLFDSHIEARCLGLTPCDEGQRKRDVRVALDFIRLHYTDNLTA